MKLKTIHESESVVVYKWMAGKDWAVSTKEGMKKEGDKLIPLYVCTDYDSLGMFFGLAYNNIGPDEDIYLATISVNNDPTLRTTQEFMTHDYDIETLHPVGSQAIKLGPEEGLVMTTAVLTRLQLAIPDATHSTCRLIDRQGQETAIQL
jgi:hypothetical protein